MPYDDQRNLQLQRELAQTKKNRNIAIGVLAALLVLVLFLWSGALKEISQVQYEKERLSEAYYQHRMPEFAKSMCGIEEVGRIGTEQARACFVGARLQAAKETGYSQERAVQNQ